MKYHEFFNLVNSCSCMIGLYDIMTNQLKTVKFYWPFDLAGNHSLIYLMGLHVCMVFLCLKKKINCSCKREEEVMGGVE